MIPVFPNFKKLELSDKEEIEKITKEFPPYSDFNFVSMWSWDTEGDMQVSILNQNLVVQFRDYITSKPFLSFIGKNKISETASILLEYSKNNFDIEFLGLVPGEMTLILDRSGFKITPDVDASDYIYKTDDLKDMHNWHEHRLGKGIKKYLELHSDYLVKISSLDIIDQEEYGKLFQKWAKSKSIIDHVESNEYKAFQRFLKIKDESIEMLSIYKDLELVGFTAYEVLSHEYATAHFSKADTNHNSVIYDILNWEEAKALSNKKITYCNWEQDLGIQGLQNAKLKYKPCFFLSKFIVKI